MAAWQRDFAKMARKSAFLPSDLQCRVLYGLIEEWHLSSAISLLCTRQLPFANSRSLIAFHWFFHWDSTMELVACLVGGLCLIACGLGLFRLHPPNWQNDGDLTDDHRRAIQRWSGVQRVVRAMNNSLMILIGCLIASTGFVPHGRAWMLLWGGVLVMLLVCILFAMIDAFSSLAGYRRALPEAARRSFSADPQLRSSE